MSVSAILLCSASNIPAGPGSKRLTAVPSDGVLEHDKEVRRIWGSPEPLSAIPAHTERLSRK